MKNQMYYLLFATICLAQYISASQDHAKRVHINHLVVAQIKQKTNQWQPYEAEENPFKDYTTGQLKKMLGLIQVSTKQNSESAPEMVTQILDPDSIPDYFDSRQQWSDCLMPVQDQGSSCGSCWAFSSTGVLSDRFCIFSKGEVKIHLSPQDLLQCDTENKGCQGGHIHQAFEHLEESGTSLNECLPYTSIDGVEQQCTTQCVNSELLPFSRFKCKPNSTQGWSGKFEIASAIYTAGPVVGQMHVYGDFFSYRGGIYVQTTELGYMGAHAIKTIGWGYDEEFNVFYWICQNSWGPDWGENGYFRIQMGECDIDDQAYSCDPLLPTTII